MVVQVEDAAFADVEEEADVDAASGGGRLAVLRFSQGWDEV